MTMEDLTEEEMLEFTLTGLLLDLMEEYGYYEECGDEYCRGQRDGIETAVNHIYDFFDWVQNLPERPEF
jgi:hypothetical protein